MIGLLEHWQKTEVPLTQARQKWLDNCTDFCVAIANFKHPADRKSLCAYAISGDLLRTDTGSVLMWSLPKNYSGNLALDEHIFQTIDFTQLMKTRAASTDILDAAVKYLSTGVQRLMRYVREKSLIIELNLKLVSLEHKKTIEEIRALNPWTISWSNVCDYFKSSEFHRMARDCSGEDTLHFAYSMNWPKRVFGASVLDYDFGTREGGEYLDLLVETANQSAQDLYRTMGFEGWMHGPPVGDARNLANSTLYVAFKDNWIEYFFSRQVSEVKDWRKQVQTAKTFYSVFARTNSSIFFVFSYDPACSLKGNTDQDLM